MPPNSQQLNYFNGIKASLIIEIEEESIIFVVRTNQYIDLPSNKFVVPQIPLIASISLTSDSQFAISINGFHML